MFSNVFINYHVTWNLIYIVIYNILIHKKSYKPSIVKMRQTNDWTTMTISNFKAKNLPNSTFTFPAKDFPQAEVIDLRK